MFWYRCYFEKLKVSKNKIIFLVALVGFVGLTFVALLEELKRNSTTLKSSISGVIHTASGIGSGIIKTDNAHIMLFDPSTLELVASKTINPFLPPLTFSIGQEDTKTSLAGAYRLLVITDKNRNISISSVGEVIGPLTKPISLGSEGIEYFLDRPFKKLPSEFFALTKNSPEKTIQGIINVSPLFKDRLDSSDSLVIMLFDTFKGRPVAIKIITSFNPPQKFSIGQANAMGNQVLEGEYSLRILTDKNNQPFRSAKGEIIGRSKELIPLGTSNLVFELDQLYTQ